MNRTKERVLNAVLIVLAAGLLISTVSLAVLYRTASGRLTAVTEDRESMKARLADLNAELSGLNAELDQLESEKKAAEAEAREKTLKIDGLESMIELLEDAQEGMTETNTQLSSRLTEANRMADSLRGDVDTLNRKIELQTEKVNALRERSSALKETVSGLEEELKDAREEIRAWEEAAAPLSSPMGQEVAELMTLSAEEEEPPAERNSADPAPADETGIPEEGVPDDNPEAPDAENPNTEIPPEEPLAPGETEPVQPDPEPVQLDPEPVHPDPDPPVEPEPVQPEPVQPEPVPVTPVKPAVRESSLPETEPVNVLMKYMEGGAPLRWDWVSGTNQLTEIYPTLAYYYEDLATGDVVSYNPDVITYAASLIKVPYIYSVLLELEQFEASHPRGADGKIVYGLGEEKYNLDEIWVYDPATMYEQGSGEIMEMEAGVSMPVRQLFEYAILYSDNIAWMQIYYRFGYDSFYNLMGRLGVQGTGVDFMDLTARDCGKILKDVYRYFSTGSSYALWLQNLMSRSKYGHLIAEHYPGVLVCHKYGWDVESYHDMAIIYDEHPYILVIMTDYEDGGATAAQYFSDVVSMTKVIHATNQ